MRGIQIIKYSPPKYQREGKSMVTAAPELKEDVPF